ncbi:LytR/AlgR family response regulator transcription factor [Microscilla marina]|nr:LytTR family DNA-binding domain-containing protein [Microscilla marina]
MNCMIVDDEDISRKVVEHFVEKTDSLTLKHLCDNAIDAINILKKDKSVDILFLDVEMPEMTGLELVAALKSTSICIVLITSKMEYAVEAFEYNVTDYIIKPINYPRFLKAVARVEEQLQGQSQSGNDTELSALFVKTDYKIVKIELEEVSYIEALSDYVIIYCGDKKYVVHSTMKGIEKKLAPAKNFLRVHRSYIVNKQHIESIQDLYVEIGGKSIPIGRSYKNNFIKNLNIL